MRWLTIIVSVFIIFMFAGCSGNEITGDVVKDIQIKDWEVLSSQCPSCPQCPQCEECAKCPECKVTECEKCEKCKTCKECEKCEACEEKTCSGDEPSEYELTSLTVYKKVRENEDEQMIDFSYTEEKYSRINSAELSFLADCKTRPERLQVFVNDEEIYDKSPACDDELTIKISKNDLKNTGNELRFVSGSTTDYRIEDIEIKTKYDDDTYNIVGFSSLKMEKTGYNNQKVDNFGTAGIKNYVEYEFSLNEDDIKNDLELRFTSEERNAFLKIYFNDDEITQEELVRDKDYKITIPKKYLEKGTNTLLILGYSG